MEELAVKENEEEISEYLAKYLKFFMGVRHDLLMILTSLVFKTGSLHKLELF